MLGEYRLFGDTLARHFYRRVKSLNAFDTGTHVHPDAGDDCSAIFFGNWGDLMIGEWGNLDILVDPYTGGTAGTLRIIVFQDVDIAVRHAESFAAMLDALTA